MQGNIVKVLGAVVIAQTVVGVGITGAAIMGIANSGDTYYVTHVSAPMCHEEDGNTDGAPCVWVDPDTGTAYHVTSENYR